MKFKIIMATCLAIFSLQAQAEVNMLNQSGQTASQEKNRLAGEAFLQKNKSKSAVVTLPSGLQYKVITPGKGEHPTEQDIVTVEYQGKLITGEEFDNSNKHGGTVDFQLGQVIPGWVEALKLMQPGATWEIYVPSNLAYGEVGAPPMIGPNETLIFKVKLVNFKKSA